MESTRGTDEVTRRLNQSARGSHFVKRLLTECEMPRMQGRSGVLWLARLLQAELGVPGVAPAGDESCPC